MYKNLELLLVLLLAVIRCSLGYMEYDSGIAIHLYHAINPNDPDEYIYRGNATIASLLAGTTKIKQETLTPQQMRNLKMLSSKDDLYRVKAVVKYNNGLERELYTVGKVRNLLTNQLNDEIWVSIDVNGYVNGLTYYVVNLGAVGDGSMAAVLPDYFKTEFIIKYTELAPVPDTASFIQRMEREAAERSESKDNRGFFAKYWMYIVPVALLVFISGASGPDPPK